MGNFGACTGLPDLVDRSSNVSKWVFGACTGLQESGRPVFNEQRGENCCMYRSSRKLKTGLLNPVRWISSRVPVYAKVEDRSSPVIRYFCEACTGLRESRRPVYTCKFADFCILAFK